MFRLARKHGHTNESIGYWTGIDPVEISKRINGSKGPVRALDRWAAAALPPGALVADGVALVVERLGEGDPDALAAEVMAEAPSRFVRNWESGPAH